MAAFRFLWERKVASKVNVFLQLLVANFYFAFETFAARPVVYGARKVLFAGPTEYGGVVAYCLLSNGNKQAHSFKRHRETGQSDPQKYGNQAGDATSGATRFQSKQGIPQSHPLWHCGRRLCRHT